MIDEHVCLLPEFDYEFYRRTYMQGLPYSAEPLAHYVQWGRERGNMVSPLAKLGGFWQYITEVSKKRKTLIIGARIAPWIRNENVHYFSKQSRDELMQTTKEAGWNVEAIPEKIDYVSSTGDMSVISGTFDVAYCSYSEMERSSNLLGYLRGISNVLNDGGLFCCTVSNRNYTYDYHQQLSTIGDIFEADVCLKGERLSLKELVNRRVYSANNEAAMHWQGNHGQQAKHIRASVDAALEEYSLSRQVAMNRWVFTESSFYDIMIRLYEAGYLDLKIKRLWPTPKDANVFNAMLVKQCDNGDVMKV